MNANLKLLQRDAAGVDEPSKASRIREALLFCVQQENAQKNTGSVGFLWKCAENGGRRADPDY